MVGRRKEQRRINGEGRTEGVGEGSKGGKEVVGDEERAQVTTNRLVGAGRREEPQYIGGHDLDVTWVS